MFEAGSWLWRCLADQPPFMEVGIGMGFVLVLAPIVLADVALVCTRIGGLAGLAHEGDIALDLFVVIPGRVGSDPWRMGWRGAETHCAAHIMREGASSVVPGGSWRR